MNTLKFYFESGIIQQLTEKKGERMRQGDNEENGKVQREGERITDYWQKERKSEYYRLISTDTHIFSVESLWTDSRRH